MHYEAETMECKSSAKVSQLVSDVLDSSPVMADTTFNDPKRAGSCKQKPNCRG